MTRPPTSQRIPTDASGQQLSSEQLWGFKPRGSSLANAYGATGPPTAGSSRPSTAHSQTGLLASHRKETERNPESSKVLSTAFPVGTALGSPLEDEYVVIDISPRSNSPFVSNQFIDFQNSLNTLGRMLDSVCLPSSNANEY